MECRKEQNIKVYIKKILINFYALNLITSLNEMPVVEWWFNIVKFKLPQLRNQCSTLYDLQSPEIETTSTSGNAFNFPFAKVYCIW